MQKIHASGYQGTLFKVFDWVRVWVVVSGFEDNFVLYLDQVENNSFIFLK
jgi:hypothetical protein